MANKSEYYSHSHQESSIETVGDFIADDASIGTGLNVKDLLLYEDELGVKNIDNIHDSIASYSSDELFQYRPIFDRFPNVSEDELNNLPLHIGTVLNLELSKIDREGLIAESFQTSNFTTFNSFLAKALSDLLKDKKYEKVYKNSNNIIATVKEIYPHISIWIWSRAMSVNLKGEYHDTIINITPFIYSLETSVTSNGGNFSFSIAPISADYVDKNWIFNSGHVKGDINNLVNESFFHTEDKDGNLKKNIFFHEKVLQQNDVVFIRFEELIIEDKRKSLEDLSIISTSSLPGNIFDMIGLIDSINLSTQSASADVIINVQGRDLMKPLIEDGVYFYPLQFTDGGLFSNIDPTNNRVKRYDGQILSRFQTFYKTIKKSLNFLKNALSTIRISSDSLFLYYGENRVMSNQVTSESQKKIEENQKNIDIKVKDILGVVKQSIIFEKIDNTPNESELNNVYSEIYDFILFLNENKLILEDNNQDIAGWVQSEYLNEKLNKNQITKNLNDILYKNERSYVDQSGNKLTNKDQVKLTKDLETQSNILQKRISGAKGGVGLSDFLSRNKVDITSNKNPSFKLIPLDVQIAQINAKFAAAETTDPQISSISNIQKKNLEDLLAQYNKITAQGASIQINIVSKFFNELNNFAQEAFKSVYKIIKDKKNIVKEEFEKFPLPGIWSIINLVVDDSVADRRIVDQSIGNEHGSLLNGIRKICQDPFVEFFSDTYGDKFYLIARKKPFDKQSIVSAINNQSSVEKDELNIKLDKKNKDDVNKDIPSNLIIDIEEIDVISDNLSFSQETYSWYRLQLQNLIGGTDNSMAFAYLKAVYFKEYADIFGSKPLDVTTNYIPYNPIIDKKNSLSAAYFIKQGTYDLKYMIESHAHLPFTRQGTITMNGDRRIKRGTFVRYKGTGEIYYVEGVANSFNIDMGSIDRTTTLQVSRGMIEKHINPNKSLDGQIYSYFNIISLPIDPEVFSDKNSQYSNFNQAITSKWSVNVDVFNFFIKRLQFLDESKYKNEFLEKFPVINQNISPSKINNNDTNNEIPRT